MLKKMILRTIVLYALIAFAILFGGGILYFIAAAIAAFIFLIIRINHKRVLKITRWANTHKVKARVVITFIQGLLILLGLYMGFNLNRAGYELPGTATIIFSLVMVTGFLSVPFLPARNIIAIPRQVNRNRLAFIGIALSFFMIMVLLGNKMESRYPGASITQAFSDVDKLIFPGDDQTAMDKEYGVRTGSGYQQSGAAVFAAFPNNNSERITPVTDPEKEAKAKLKADKKAKKLEKKKAKQLERIKKRMGLSSAMAAGAVILIILLAIGTCAGICLIIAGFSGSAGLIPLGILVAGGSIYGIIQVAKQNRRLPIVP